MKGLSANTGSLNNSVEKITQTSSQDNSRKKGEKSWIEQGGS